MKKTIIAVLAIALLLSGCNLESKAGQEQVMSLDGDQGPTNAITLTQNGKNPPFKVYLKKTNDQMKERMKGVYDKFISLCYKDDFGDGSMAYIYDNGKGNEDIRSEGMSYGMMITLQMNDKERFKKLWDFTKKYMMIKGNDKLEGFFNCYLYDGIHDPPGRDKKLGDVKKYGVAPDGEIYFAMSLIFAYNRWGITEYRDAARTLLVKMINNFSSDKNETDLFYSNKLIKHWPKDNQDNLTNPSYMCPAFFELYTDFLPSDWTGTIKKWKKITDASRTFLKKVLDISPFGLSSQRTQFNGKPIESTSEEKEFLQDAWRVAMNLALDADWNGMAAYGNITDQYAYWLWGWAKKYCTFFESKSSDKIKDRDYQDQWDVMTGEKPIKTNNRGHAQGLVAMNAMAACLMHSQSGTSNRLMTERYLKDLWEINPFNVNNYYQISLVTLATLWATGNYRHY